MIWFFILFTAIILITSIFYDQRKLNRIKKEISEATLFDDLINSGFILSDSTNKINKTQKWLSKKEENDEFEYHCCFYIDKGKIHFEAILEIKRRVINNNNGIIFDFKLSRRYKEKDMNLAGRSFIKYYKVKKVTNLPKVPEIINDLNEMKKILKKENIRTLNKFEV